MYVRWLIWVIVYRGRLSISVKLGQSWACMTVTAVYGMRFIMPRFWSQCHTYLCKKQWRYWILCRAERRQVETVLCSKLHFMKCDFSSQSRAAANDSLLIINKLVITFLINYLLSLLNVRKLWKTAITTLQRPKWHLLILALVSHAKGQKQRQPKGCETDCQHQHIFHTCCSWAR